MALYKLIRDWGGFEKGQVIEVVSESRLEAMRGDADNLPAGEPYVPEPEKVIEPVADEVKPPVKKGKKRGK